jgi:hypothetical protein
MPSSVNCHAHSASTRRSRPARDCAYATQQQLRAPGDRAPAGARHPVAEPTRRTLATSVDRAVVSMARSPSRRFPTARRPWRRLRKACAAAPEPENENTPIVSRRLPALNATPCARAQSNAPGSLPATAARATFVPPPAERYPGRSAEQNPVFGVSRDEERSRPRWRELPRQPSPRRGARRQLELLTRLGRRGHPPTRRARRDRAERLWAVSTLGTASRVGVGAAR